MSYSGVEGLLASQLGSIAGFSTDGGTGNVSKGDYRILTRGVASAIIVEYGGFDQKRTAEAGEHQIDWRFNLLLFARWLDETNAVLTLGTARQLIIDRINQYPKLGSLIVFDAMVTSGDVTPEDIEMGGIRYALEILRCIASEDVSVSYAE